MPQYTITCVVNKMKEVQANMPHIIDPSIRIVCGDKTISLVRKAGGVPTFLLIEPNCYTTKSFKYITINNEKAFNILWKNLEELEVKR